MGEEYHIDASIMRYLKHKYTYTYTHVIKNNKFLKEFIIFINFDKCTQIFDFGIDIYGKKSPKFYLCV